MSAGIFCSRRRRMAGIDVGRAAIKVVVLRRAWRRWRLEAYRVAPLQAAGADAAQQALQNALSAIPSHRSRVAAALPATQALTHQLELPGPLSDMDIEAWVLQVARQHMPCALDDVLMDFHRARDGNTIMLAAMRKDIAGRRTDLLRRCRLTPDVLDLDALALRRSTVAVYDGRHLPADSRVVIVDIGAASVRLHALQGVHIVYSREQLISGLQDLSPENVRWRLVQEIRRALQLFQASFSCGVWAKVILAGGYAAVAGLDAELSELTGVHVALADPFANMLIRPGLDLRELAGLKTILAQACGLAMSQVY